MFCRTLQITPQKVTVSLRKKRNDREIKDKRGETAGGWNKTPQRHIDLIIDVIKRLPKYESHYRREKNSDALYLQPGMTVPKIYELFKIEFEKEFGKDEKCPSFNVVRHIFVQKFNLRCKSLKKDTCNKCDLYEMTLKNSTTSAERANAQREKEEHQKIAEDLRKKLKEDFEQAKTCEETECLTYDLEKTLPLPRIPTNIVFYKRQLWVYNCGIHSASNGVGNCFVWAEGEAGRGAQEVGSCLRKYIKCVLPPTVKKLILWSDCCGGQNRNIKIVLILKALLNRHPTLETISFRYLESGHTFLPNDNDFAKIETRLKQYERIYSVDDYIAIMKQCKNKNPLQVQKMESCDFVGSQILEKKIVNRKIFNDKSKVNWLKTKEILITKKTQHSLFMRTSFNEDYKELNIKKKLKGVDLGVIEEDLQELWPSGKLINKKKLNDLKSLFHLIPNDCIGYYKKLKGDDAIIDDIDGYCDEPDFDLDEE